MSVEVSIPKEITEYKEKILFGLSIRQLIFFSIALVVGVGVYFLSLFHLGKDLASYLTIIVVMPIFAVGFLQKDGYTFDKYIKIMLQHKFKRSKRYYKTELLLDDIKNKDEEIDKSKKKTNFVKELIKIRGEKNGNFKNTKNRQECKEYNDNNIFKREEKKSKGKIKGTISKIKTAQQEYRKAKQGAR